MPVNVEILEPYCRNLPDMPLKKIPRDHLVELIERTLDGGANVIQIIGESLSGKSDLAADLYRRTPLNAIGIFIGGDSYLRSKDYIRLVVAEQIHWITEQKSLEVDVVGEADFRIHIHKLQRFSRKRKTLWIIDGLTNGDDSDVQATIEILGLFPLGFRDFNFVFTGESDATKLMGSAFRSPKSIDLMSVSVDEARNYFSDLLTEEKDIQEIRAICKGVVGHMSIMRNLLLEGAGVENLLRKSNHSLDSLLEIEWKKIREINGGERLIAYIVFSERPCTVDRVASYLKKSEDEVLGLIGQLRILTIANDLGVQKISVSSNALKRFAKVRLSGWADDIRRATIEELLNAADTSDAVIYLPAHLATAGRHTQLLENLDKDHFVRLLQINQTLRSLRQHAEFGREAARSLNEAETEISFSLISSILTGLTLAVGRVEHIEALTRLGLHELALEIAVVAPTAEERLHLLARAITGLQAKDYPISESIKAQVYNLAEEVGGEDMGELGIDVACDLLSVDVKLAQSFLNRVVDGASRKDEGDEQVAKTFFAVDADTSIQRKSEFSRRNVGADIPVHKRERFWREASRRVKKLKSASLQRKLDGEDPDFSLAMCATWLQGNRENSEAVEVVGVALDLILAITTRAPRVQDLIELGKVLPYIADIDERENLCSRVETQFRVLGHLGTTVESVRLRMQLHRARHVLDTVKTESKLIDLYIEIQALQDLGTRLSCWAWMLYHLSMFKNAAEMEKNTDIAALTYKELISTCDALLSSVADHFKIAEEALTALSRFSPKLAMEFVAKLNTSRSRNQGYEFLVQALLSRQHEHGDIIVKAVEQIDEPFSKSNTATNALLTIRRLKETGEGSESLHSALMELWRAVELEGFKFQSVLVTLAYSTERKDEKSIRELASVAETLWVARSPDFAKIELGYLAARELADVDRVAASEWIEKTEELSSSIRIGSEAASNALAYTVGLATRVMPAACADNPEKIDELLPRLAFLVASLPTLSAQASIWSALTVRLHFAGKLEHATKLVERYLSPLLVKASELDSCTKDLLIAQTAPALFVVHPTIALHRVESMHSTYAKHSALANIVTTIFQKTPHWEPYAEEKDAEYPLTERCITDILLVLEKCSHDSLIFGIVGDLCRSMAADKNRPKVSKNFALEALRRIDVFTRRALPDSRNIKHDGYFVASQSYVLSARFRITNEPGHIAGKAWASLLGEARNISNVSDRSIVTAYVGSKAKNLPLVSDKSWLESVKEDLAAIPAAYDRLDRYQWVAKIVQGKDKIAARSLVTEAMRLSADLSGDAVRAQQQLLDIAQSIDPELADDLLEKLDTDEARREKIKKHLSTHASKKAIAAKPNNESIQDLDDKQLSEICHQNLGSLLAGRINSRPVFEFLDLSDRAKSMSVQDSAPVWEWILENVARKQYTGAKMQDSSPRKLFEAICRAGEITQGILGRLPIPKRPQGADPSTVFSVGDRDLFVNAVEEWAAALDGEQISISDPYFAPSDISFLQLLHRAAPNSSYRILTSREHMKKSSIESAEDAFLDAWQELSDLDPPKVKFGVIGYGSAGKHPIHDRWIVAESSGLRLGSSINSIGLTRVSEMNPMAQIDAKERNEIISEYFFNPPKQFGNQRLTISYFVLR